MLRRAEASRSGAKRLVGAIMVYYGSYCFERLHPLQCGIFRRKIRTTSAVPHFAARENPLVFYPRRVLEMFDDLRWHRAVLPQVGKAFVGQVARDLAVQAGIHGSRVEPDLCRRGRCGLRLLDRQ